MELIPSRSNRETATTAAEAAEKQETARNLITEPDATPPDGAPKGLRAARALSRTGWRAPNRRMTTPVHRPKSRAHRVLSSAILRQ